LKSSVNYRDADGLPVFETQAVMAQESGKFRAGDRVTLRLVPFASAGASGSQFTVWMAQSRATAASGEGQ
jgi:hypothetical protein